MVKKDVKVINPTGIHLRPAGNLVKMAKKCTSETLITKDGKSEDPKRLLKLLTLEIGCGSIITVSCDGPNEEEDLKMLVDYIESGLGELDG